MNSAIGNPLSGAAGVLPRPVPVRLRVLALTIAARALTHGAFAAWLFTQRPGWSDVFQTGATFGLVDGVLALVIAALVVPLARERAPRLLATMTFIDGVGRLATAVALRVFPGLTDFAVSAVSFFGVVGACTAALGVVAMTAWLIARLRAGRAWSRDTDALFDPLGAAALGSFVLGYILFLNPPTSAPELRRLGEIASAGLCVAFLIAAAGALAHRPPRELSS